MSFSVSVRDDFRSAIARFEANVGKNVEQAAASALNRTAASVRADATKRIRGRYNLKAGVIRKQMRITRASRSRLVSSVIASGKRIPLIEFGARQNRRGVSVKVTRERKQVRGVFIAKMPGGHVGVFERTGKQRLPIKELFSISLPQAFTQREIFAALKRTATERFRIEFARALKFRSG